MKHKRRKYIRERRYQKYMSSYLDKLFAASLNENYQKVFDETKDGINLEIDKAIEKLYTK